MSNTVAIIGTGLMGSGMARTLTGKGYSVTAFDLSKEALSRVVEYGAIAAESLKEAVSGASYILLSLPAPQHVKAAIGEIIESVPQNSGVTVIDFSTIDPATAIECAEACISHGICHLEAPVSGGPQGANSGTLAIMVAGEEATYEESKPLLDDLGANVYYLGETGKAAVVKLCNNIVVGATIAALSEAFVVASSVGVTPAELSDILSKSVGASKTLDIFGKHIVSGDYAAPTFALGLMHKDLGLFVDTARQYGVTSFIGNTTYQMYNSAKRSGWERNDHSVVCRVVENLSQHTIERDRHQNN